MPVTLDGPMKPARRESRLKRWMRIIAGTILFAIAVGAAADETSPKPDFSRDALMRTFAAHEIDLPERPGPRVKFRFGGMEFHALGTDWRIMYLPVFMPLSGSAPTTSKTFPDPFALTGASIATMPQHFPTRREVNAELRRIRRTESRRARLDARSQ